MTEPVGSEGADQERRDRMEGGKPNGANRDRRLLTGMARSMKGNDKEPSQGEKSSTTEKEREGAKMDYGALLTGYLMLGIALALVLVSLSIRLWGLDSVFTGKRFPDDVDTPCFLAFLVMGIIFFTLGVVYRDMAVHPELFVSENGGRTEHLRKQQEWEAIKRRVKEMEIGDSEPAKNGGSLDDKD